MTTVESYGDEMDSDDWEGRSLDLEKRMKKLIKASEAQTKNMLEAMIKDSEACIIDAVIAGVKRQTPDARSRSGSSGAALG